MKRKQFFFILSTCLALSAYSPVSAAEATFSSFEEDETFVSEDEVYGADILGCGWKVVWKVLTVQRIRNIQ